VDDELDRQSGLHLGTPRSATLWWSESSPGRQRLHSAKRVQHLDAARVSNDVQEGRDRFPNPDARSSNRGSKRIIGRHLLDGGALP
jgi:hypothetical protein